MNALAGTNLDLDCWYDNGIEALTEISTSPVLSFRIGIVSTASFLFYWRFLLYKVQDLDCLCGSRSFKRALKRQELQARKEKAVMNNHFVFRSCVARNIITGAEKKNSKQSMRQRKVTDSYQSKKKHRQISPISAPCGQRYETKTGT